MISSYLQPSHTYAPYAVQNDSPTSETALLSRSPRNIGERRYYWPQNSTIKIAVFDRALDSEYVKAIEKAASAWLPHINLKFEFVAGNKGDVRIQPAPTTGGSSALGITATMRGQAIESMTLPSDHKHPRFEYVVLHEFAHMLGARHAHQHPDAHIPWNREKVYEYYKRTENLGKYDVDQDILPLPKSRRYDLLPYDADSVTHYEIKPELTDGNWGQSDTWSLSDGDIAWAKKAYPKEQAAESPVT